MDIKYNAFYDLAKSFFPNATVDWFQRGQPTKRWFTLDERGDTFNCSLVRIPDEEFSREIFLGTLATALGKGSGHHIDDGFQGIRLHGRRLRDVIGVKLGRHQHDGNQQRHADSRHAMFEMIACSDRFVWLDWYGRNILYAG